MSNASVTCFFCHLSFRYAFQRYYKADVPNSINSISGVSHQHPLFYGSSVSRRRLMLRSVGDRFDSSSSADSPWMSVHEEAAGLLIIAADRFWKPELAVEPTEDSGPGMDVKRPPWAGRGGERQSLVWGCLKGARLWAGCGEASSLQLTSIYGGCTVPSEVSSWPCRHGWCWSTGMTSLVSFEQTLMLGKKKLACLFGLGVRV
jgi:hypothetical protein